MVRPQFDADVPENRLNKDRQGPTVLVARCRIALAAVDHTLIGIEPHRPNRVCGQ